MTVIDNLQRLISSFGETLEPYLSDMVPRLIENLAIKNDQVKRNSMNVITQIIKRYGGDKLIEIYLDIFGV